jgi:hypothetical protein
MILILIILSILLAATGDGFNDSDRKTVGHVLRALSVLSLLLVPLYYTGGFGWLIAAYILLRVGLFDITYNIVRKLPICFIGTTSLWDKFVMLFNPPCWAMLFGRIMCIFAGTIIIIQNLL